MMPRMSSYWQGLCFIFLYRMSVLRVLPGLPNIRYALNEQEQQLVSFSHTHSLSLTRQGFLSWYFWSTSLSILRVWLYWLLRSSLSMNSCPVFLSDKYIIPVYSSLSTTLKCCCSFCSAQLGDEGIQLPILILYFMTLPHLFRQLMTMNYRSVMAQFNAQGLSENSLLTFDQLQDVLDRLMRKSTQEVVPNFNHEIAQELWGQCVKNPNQQIMVSQYAQVLMQAKEILDQRMNQEGTKVKAKILQRQELQRQMVQARNTQNEGVLRRVRQQLQDLNQEIYDLEEDCRNFDTDLKVISVPFIRAGNGSDSFSRSRVQSLGLPDPDAKMINGRLDNSRRMHSQFFMKRSNTTLTVLFYMSILLLLLEMLVMFQKHHFLGVLSALCILGIFALNYFNNQYVQLLLVMTFGSVLLDIGWLVLSFLKYWTPSPFSTIPRLFPGYLKLVLLGVIIVITIKVILFLILLSYRGTQEAGDVSCCCCTLSVFPQGGPFKGSGRPVSYQPNMI